MSLLRKSRGSRGEELAVSYLKKKRYHILERNFRIRNGEIDIIAVDTTEKPYTLVFIEVKTRLSNEFGTPFEAIGYHKLQALLRTAEIYTISHRNLPDLLRVDAIGVVLDQTEKLVSIEHIKNIS